MAESFRLRRVNDQEGLACPRRRGTNHRGDTERVNFEVKVAVEVAMFSPLLLPTLVRLSFSSRPLAPLMYAVERIAENEVDT